MKLSVDELTEMIKNRLFIELEASGRHVHLTKQAALRLFGHALTEKRPLSQPPTSVPDSAAVSAVFSIVLPVLL